VPGVETEYPNIEAISGFMRDHDIEKTVLLATYFPHKQSGVSNFRLYDWIRGNHRFAMFGSLDFQYYPKQGLNELSEMAERGLICGIKIYTSYQDVDLQSSTFKQVLGLAHRYSLPLMFHAGVSYAGVRKYSQSARLSVFTAATLDGVIKNNPDVNFIISHMSKPFFKETVRVCEFNHNAYADMSGLIDSTFEVQEKQTCVEAIKRFLENCGPKKLLFGTDFPVQTHADSVYFIEESMRGFCDSDRDAVYRGNAESVIFSGLDRANI
jgi:predicted TIM-barrel fold metal-dependent hydrolase